MTEDPAARRTEEEDPAAPRTEDEDPAAVLAALVADTRGWLSLHRGLHVGPPWGPAPELPDAPRSGGASPGRSAPGRPGDRRLPRASDLPAARRLPRASDLPAARRPPRASDAPAAHGVPRASDAPAARRLPRASDLPAAPRRAVTAPPRIPLAEVERDLGACTRCALHRGRTRLVFGAGNPDADLLLVGEGPGYHEDQGGIPFVGAAGELLDRILSNVLRLNREDVYICNVVKCRPPGNRDPTPEEVATCSPVLRAQLAAVQPKVVVGLGRFAVNTLLGTQRSLASARGAVHRLRHSVLVATFHPAYLLRNPQDKRETMRDMMLVRQELERATGTPLPPPLRGRGG